MKDITKIIIFGTIGIIIMWGMYMTLHDLNQGIQNCKDLGYDGIKFTGKYTLNYVCLF